MNVEIINPFLLSTRNVFEKMIHVRFSIGKPYLKRPTERLYKLYETSAAVTLAGAGAGLVAFHLTRTAALALASGISGETVRELDHNCLDALGEITSMIAGGAKKDLPGGQITLSTPRILRAHLLEYPVGLPVLSIPADAGVGRFLLEIAFAPVPPLLTAAG